MDTGFVILTAVFAVGLVIGYGIRAWMSWRRRRRHMF